MSRIPTAQSAPQTIASPSGTRVGIVVTLLLGSLVLLGFRVVHLQWWSQSPLASRAEDQALTELLIPARPGDILDRTGRVLASTVTVKSLYIDPSKVESPWETASELGRVLEIDPDRLFERLHSAREKRFLWVKRRLTEADVNRVRSAGLLTEAIGFRDEYLRRYPQGKLAAHVLGLRDIDGHGRGGIEEAMNDLLTGTDGKRTVTRDAHGRVIEVLDKIERTPVHGKSIQLTIDAVLQMQVERELAGVMQEWKPTSACAIVLDPETGEVLAMASAPDYDPNLPSEAAADAWKNSAISAIYEPGSTLKPIIVASALQDGLIRRDESFHCGWGQYRMGPRILHDHHSYGDLSLTNVLVKSSNVGMAKIGERMGNANLHRTLIDFGFGQRTGLELSGELKGQVRPANDWNIYSTGSIPMGQEVSVTPIQLITAHCVLANGGHRVQPTLIRQTSEHLDQPTGPNRPAEPALLVDSEIARWLVEHPMAETITRGTGRRGRIEEWSTFGKTGTAQKVDPKTGGYSHSHHVASFVCGGPVHRPEAVVLVVVDDPSTPGNHYGGTIAAPAASRILKATLKHLGTPLDSDLAGRP